MRSLLLARWNLAWSGVLLLSAALLSFVPLFDLLGYEFSAAMGVLAGIGAGYLGVRVVAWARETRRRDGVGVLFGRTWALALLGLIPPLLASLLNALRVRNCSVAEGLLFYLLIPVVSVTYGAAGGVCFGLGTRSRRRGFLAWIGWITAGVAILLVNVISQPPKFAYEALIGFIAGPIYDEEVRITATLLIARGVALLIAACFLTVAWALHDPSNQRLTPRALLYGSPNRQLPAVLALVLLTGLGVAWGFRGPLGIRPTRRYIQRALGGRFETEHFVLYYERGSEVGRKIALIAEDHEFRYAQLRGYFGFDVSRKIGAYIYTSPAQKKRLMGARYTDMADPLSDEIHLNDRGFPNPVLKHELAHLFAGEFHPVMKLSRSGGLLEGIATAAAWNGGRLTAHESARAMEILDQLPPIERVMSTFGFWSLSSSRAYPAAGSFVSWLVETYGMDRFARVFAWGNFRKQYGKTLSELSDEWREYLHTVPVDERALAEARRRFSRRSLFEKTCAHEIANLEADAWKRYAVRDYDGARALFERIARFEPQNPERRWPLVQVDIAARRWEAVRREATGLMNDANADEALRLRSREAIGDADWRLGDIDVARVAFDAVRAAAFSRETTRRVIVKAEATRLDPSAQRLVQRMFEPGRRDVRLYDLRELTLQAPDWSLGHYLLGRGLFAAEEWEGAIDALARAERLGLPDDDFGFESARLRGEALYRLRRWDATRAAFEAMRDHASSAGLQLSAEDWIKRTAWAMGSKGRIVPAPAQRYNSSG